MKWLVLCIIMFSILPASLAQSSYNKFPTCQVSSDRCLTFSANPDKDEILFSYEVFGSSNYMNQYRNLKITQVSIGSNSYGGYYGDDEFRCSKVLYGYSPDSLTNSPLLVNIGQPVYVKAEGCNLEWDKWHTASINIVYVADQVNQGNYNREYNPSEYGNIRVFAESRDYAMREKMNRYVWRFIPLGVLVLLGVIGFYRVKRC